MFNNALIRESSKLLFFVRPYWKHMVMAIVCMVIYTAASGIQISLIKPIIDKLILEDTKNTSDLPVIDIDQTKQEDNIFSPIKKFKKQTLSKLGFVKKIRERATGSFTSIGFVIITLAPIIFFSSYFQNYYRSLVRWAVVVDIRNKVCDHLLPQPLSFFENRKSGDLLSRLMNDISVMQSGLVVLFDDMLLLPMQMICGLVLAFYFSWKLSLFSFFAFPIVFIPALILGKKIKKHGKGSLRHLSNLTDSLREMFAGIRIVKAFRMENEESREIQEISKQFLKRRMKLVKTKALQSSITEGINTVGFALMIIFTGYVLMTNKITPGELGGFITAIGFMVITAVKKLAKSYTSLQESLSGASRVFELLTIESTITDHPDAISLGSIEKGIEFKNVSFSYDGSNTFVLKDISLSIQKGEVVAIVGESGTGKTSFLNLIPRFYDPIKGCIEIDGTDIRKISRDSLLENIAIVTQQTFLFNRSLHENIFYGRKSATTEEIYEAAKAANIHEFIMSLPNGYDTVVGEMGVKLSGGQRQRIAIARAILKNAPILLLDEATSSLDYESEKVVQEALNNLIMGRTTIIVAHRLSTIQHCDRIIVMKKGHIVEMGSHKSLMSIEGEYKRVYLLHSDTIQE
ncbi:MAG: ABC transporter ATP-binding protein/permease [Candidatus Brocadiaceae bacterium]|nr:ABC transporter ATP-binding protein/permease [Candidatus Brocadiaceae bacterium]